MDRSWSAIVISRSSQVACFLSQCDSLTRSRISPDCELSNATTLEVERGVRLKWSLAASEQPQLSTRATAPAVQPSSLWLVWLVWLKPPSRCSEALRFPTASEQQPKTAQFAATDGACTATATSKAVTGHLAALRRPRQSHVLQSTSSGQTFPSTPNFLNRPFLSCPTTYNLILILTLTLTSRRFAIARHDAGHSRNPKHPAQALPACGSPRRRLVDRCCTTPSFAIRRHVLTF